MLLTTSDEDQNKDDDDEIITRKIVTINKSKDNVHDDDHYWGAARWKTQQVAEHSLVGTLLFHCWLSIADDSGDEDFKIKSYMISLMLL